MVPVTIILEIDQAASFSFEEQSMRARITGAGHYVPTKVVTNHDLARRKDGKIKDESTVLMAAFCAGFTWGSAIVRF